MPDQAIWKPTAGRIAASHMQAFLHRCRPASGADDYPALHAWSISEPDSFWPAVREYCGLRLEREPDRVLENATAMPGARWFTGARLNFAENLLERDAPGPAIVFCDERGRRRELGRDELRRAVAGLAAGLRKAGVAPGDRVAAVLPNCPEAVIGALASASIGAVWSSCSPDFGRGALLDRLSQIEPKVLLGVDGYAYRGKTIDCRPVLESLRAALPSIETLGLVAFADEGFREAVPPGMRAFADLLVGSAEPRYESLPFDHPLAILFSSGTTGPPKCIVHGAGGTLLQHQKEHVLHCDIRPGDRVFYYTTCGWMMWNWLLSTLAAGATLVLYDGAPFHPDPGALWRMAEREAVTVFGTSARYLSALEKSAYVPKRYCDLSALRTLLSTGSPLAPASFDFVYGAVASDLMLASISGGTDIVSCFALGNPLLPVYRGEIQCRGLGMDVRVLDDAGRELHGEKGQLVCASPFPSMPLGFWNDPDQSRYRETYFARYPGVWWHGDYAEITQHGGIVMHGRSDAVLNPGGVRIGTSEIYRIVEQLPEISECVVVGQEFDGDTRIVLFVQPGAGQTLDEALEARIRDMLRSEASPRHVPAVILAVPDIPRTISGKVSELAVRDVIHGREVANADALANPDALDHFRDRPELAA